MKRALALGLAIGVALLSGTAARAQTSFQSCIDQTQSWTRPFSTGTLKAVTYIVSVPVRGGPGKPDGVALGWLIGLFAAPSATEVLVGIPAASANKFQQTQNGDALFAQLTRTSHEMILIDGTLCPLLAENTAFSLSGPAVWSH